MALIPKISIGKPTKRSTNNWSFDSHTTANIGFIQPTMARLLPNDSHIEVSNNTLVRMSPLVNPTFGRLSQRDYYRFVRMSDVYLPWAQFLSGKSFTTEDGTSYIPTTLPKFKMFDAVMKIILKNSYLSVTPKDYPDEPIKALSDNNIADFLSSFLPKLMSWEFDDYYQTLNDHSYSIELPTDVGRALDDVFGLGTFLTILENGKTAEWYLETGFDFRENIGLEPVSYSNSDFTFFIPSSAFADVPDIQQQHPNGQSYVFSPKSDGCYVHFRLKPAAKNLRKIFIGLGYQFNPFDNEQKTPFALLAYYKAWFDEFMPQRNIQFTDTKCYRIIKMLESGQTTSYLDTFLDWLVTDCFDAFYYYSAPDYFSASLYNLGDNSLNSGEVNGISQSVVGNIDSNTSVSVLSNNAINAGPSPQNLITGLTVQMMLRVLRFTNKNNVIGRNIREYLRTHYGIDDVNMDTNQTVKIDAHKVDIDFFQVMNQTESSEAFLGEFAGQGFGSKKSGKTFFDTKDWGFFFCMSAIIPENGYYQGSLHELTLDTKEEFMIPEYDALGYDVISRAEILNNHHVFTDENGSGRNLVDTAKGFGFIPRSSFIKIAKNIVNGDLSLHSTETGLQGYFLDKQFPTIKEKAFGTNGGFRLVPPTYSPDVVSDNIRKIDISDEVGNYNRIFQYTNVDMDHFIIMKVFDCKVTALWKSLKDSFDTVQNDETVIERNHQ